jgi:hypothetical protein
MFDFSKRLEDFETGKPTGGRGARGKYNREERAPRSGGFSGGRGGERKALVLVMHQVVMVVVTSDRPAFGGGESHMVLQHVRVSVAVNVSLLGQVLQVVRVMLVVAVVVVVQVLADEVHHLVVADEVVAQAVVACLLNRVTNSICLLRQMNQESSSLLLTK